MSAMASPSALQVADEARRRRSDPNAIPLDQPRGEIEIRNVVQLEKCPRAPRRKGAGSSRCLLRVEPGQTFAIRATLARANKTT